MKEYKQVTWKQLTIGQEILGTVEPGRWCSWKGYVKSINPAYVTVAMWKPDGKEEQISSSVMFDVEMTDDDFKAKYYKQARELYKNIQNRLAAYEIGTHEMWNLWISCDPYEMAQYEIKYKFKVIGYCTDIIPKTSWLGNILDIGICMEYEDGERYWCHSSMYDLNAMLEDYKEDFA